MANATVDEDESILAAIFREAFPDSCGDNAEFAEYLAELSSYGIEKLNREPDRLAEEKAQILEQTQDLAFHNYKTFIQTAECCREIFQDFQIIEKHVDSMLLNLPQLNLQCNDFAKQAQKINSSRKMNGMTLQKHAQLLEILEMPQLMDTCVRNGYYEEALELTAHVKRLEKKHSSIPVIENIVNEVKVSTQLMLDQLVQQLRTNVQLPTCLRVIGYLRRMDVFTEAELRIKFLQARDTWFQSVLKGIPNDDPYYHISKTIEASRVHLFDIITQYKAIFSDDDPVMSALSTRAEDKPNDGALFNGWVIQKVTQFLQTLESDLDRGVRGRLDSLLGQCMYFGLSFSRVGADFRGLLAPIFQKAVLVGFTEAMNEADARLQEMLNSYTLLGTPSVAPSSIYNLSIQTSAGIQPPTILLEFQPLAVYCNNVLTAFNDLRLCAPIGLACDVAECVDQSLKRAVDLIVAYHRVDETTFNEQEQIKFGQLCRAFARSLVPFINNCLQSLFPPAQISALLGLPVTELHNFGMIGRIDPDSIIEAMLPLLPAEPEPVVAEAAAAAADTAATTAVEEAVSAAAVTSQSEPATSTEAISSLTSNSATLANSQLEPATSTEVIGSQAEQSTSRTDSIVSKISNDAADNKSVTETKSAEQIQEKETIEHHRDERRESESSTSVNLEQSSSILDDYLK